MGKVFSSRVPANLAPNRVTSALAALRAAGDEIIDLTESNPTRVGLDYPDDLLQPLARVTGLRYEPEPLGLMTARSAVAADYARRGVSVQPDRLFLSASTSEAYSALFKLLVSPGESILVPVPSYPLLDHLARLEGLRTASFWLEYHGRWSVDVESMRRALTADARAVVLVHPNNPTGSLVGAEELGAVAGLCRAHGLALILDEVFLDYPIATEAVGRAAIEWPDDVLTFRLGGLSKSVGLPQLKLGWCAMQGPPDQLAEARDRLEFICDTYLSVATPVQLAAPTLLERGAVVRSQIVERIRSNHRLVRDIVGRHPACQLLRFDAGWSAVIQVPAIRSEETLMLELLELDRVLVHPGHYFDFPREAFVIVSLLPPADSLSEGVERLLARAETP